MAKIYPTFGPKTNDSLKAEPHVYNLLKKLDDDFTVIHSLAWLMPNRSSQNKSMIGEIDFIIFHPHYGVLAIEVKGGKVHIDKDGFYYDKSDFYSNEIKKQYIDPEKQLSRGLWPLQNILNPFLKGLKISRAFIFPDSNLNIMKPSLCYGSFSLLIEKKSLPFLEEKIIEIMMEQKRYHNIPDYDRKAIDFAVNALLPSKRSIDFLSERIDYDKKFLKFTREQYECAIISLMKRKSIITGWPGSGKTLVLLQLANYFSKLNLKVLFLTQNSLLRDKIYNCIKDYRCCDVYTLYGFVGGSIDIKDHEKMEKSLKLKIDDGGVEKYDILIIDESQAFNEKYWQHLYYAFREKRIVAGIDESQKFIYETGCTLSFLEELFEDKAYVLCESLRIPKKVCDRIKLFQSPKYSIINKRDDDDDTLQEIITDDKEYEVRKILDELFVEGVSPEEICILAPFSSGRIATDLIPQGVTVESIGRFRGLEKPIVIIYGANNITDLEFFCSYSRATSKCIVILDVKRINDGDYDSLGKNLTDNKSNEINDLVLSQSTNKLLESLDFSNTLIFSYPTKVYWSKKIGSYFVLSDKNPILSVLLAEYLSLDLDFSVVYYFPNSINSLYLRTEDSSFTFDAFVAKCPVCNEKILFHSGSCLSCNKVSKKNDVNHGVILAQSDMIKEISGKSLEFKKTLNPRVTAILGVMKRSSIFEDETLIGFFKENYEPKYTALFAHVIISMHIITRSSKTNYFKIGDIISFICSHSDDYNFDRLSLAGSLGYIFGLLEKKGLVDKDKDKGKSGKSIYYLN
ncbi:NERD domain-containing protein [Marinomonas rhizomae]|uniref:DNA/RNA helicase domain-containing protein n=1 Tax=Marinomonas rhizomae TaxID=491948 RepID=UPI00210844F7|nr:NERD domain-containing protein [Marinomonas rhizomae]UTV99783.1 NERD domain-containing protein [Marinomonas rhizomae]